MLFICRSISLRYEILCISVVYCSFDIIFFILFFIVMESLNFMSNGETILFLLDFLSKNILVYFLILISLSIVGAKLIDLIFIKFLKNLVHKTKSDFDDKILDLIHRPLYYSLLFIGFGFSISIENFYLSSNIIFVINAIMKSILIVLWSIAFLKIFVLLIQISSSKSSNSKLLSSKLVPLFDNIGKIIIFTGSIYLIMVSWGMNPVGWLASAGVLGIVLGLAAKDTIANLFSGIFIMVDSPYKEGDYINLDSGERGYVKNIGIRSTRIMTRDDIEITVPNSVIANAKIINESGGPYENERVRLSIGVAYGSDIDKVKNILIKIATESGMISEKFEPRVRFRSFGDSSLDFELLFWIDKPEARGRTLDFINSKIYKEFNKNNIEIPFPQRTVHIKK